MVRRTSRYCAQRTSGPVEPSDRVGRVVMLSCSPSSISSELADLSPPPARPGTNSLLCEDQLRYVSPVAADLGDPHHYATPGTPAGFGRGGFQGVAGRVAHPVTLVISAMRQPSAAKPSGLVPSLSTSLASGDMCPVASDRTLAIGPRISAVMSILCLSSLVSGQRPATGHSEPSTPNTAEGCPSALAACPFGEPYPDGWA